MKFGGGTQSWSGKAAINQYTALPCTIRINGDGLNKIYIHTKGEWQQYDQLCVTSYAAKSVSKQAFLRSTEMLQIHKSKVFVKEVEQNQVSYFRSSCWESDDVPG